MKTVKLPKSRLAFKDRPGWVALLPTLDWPGKSVTYGVHLNDDRGMRWYSRLPLPDNLVPNGNGGFFESVWLKRLPQTRENLIISLMSVDYARMLIMKSGEQLNFTIREHSTMPQPLRHSALGIVFDAFTSDRNRSARAALSKYGQYDDVYTNLGSHTEHMLKLPDTDPKYRLSWDWLLSRANNGFRFGLNFPAAANLALPPTPRELIGTKLTSVDQHIRVIQMYRASGMSQAAQDREFMRLAYATLSAIADLNQGDASRMARHFLTTYAPESSD